MIEKIVIEDITCVNTSESTFGDALLLGNEIIFPFFNVNITSEENPLLKHQMGNYIKYCHLVFQNVSGIVWDYELSRSLGEKGRECYGGVYFRDNSYHEFWIKYDRGFIQLEKDYISSSKPFKWNEQDDFLASER